MSGAFAKRRAEPGIRKAKPCPVAAFERRPRAKKPKGYFLGGLLGGLTGGQGGGGTSSFNQTSTTSYDPKYTDYFHNVLNKSENLYGTMKDKTSNDAIAGFTPDQITAQQGVRGNQGAYQPYFDKASGAYDAATSAAAGIGTAGAGAFGSAMATPGGAQAAQPYFDQASGRFTDPGVADSYMSPYLDQVAGNVTRLSNQNLMENTLPAVNDTFSGGTMGAQFGRERHADITGRAIRDQQNTLTGNLANIYNTGFGNAQGQYNADQSRLGGLGASAGNLANSTIGAFGQLGGQQTNAAATGVSGQIGAGQAQAALGQGTQGAGYTDAAALGQSGATQQALQQQGKTFNMQYPWQLLQTQQGLGQGWQVGSTTNTQGTSQTQQQQASGSPLGSILGAGMGIAGLGVSGGGTLGGNFLSGLFGAAHGGVVPERKYAHGGRVDFAAGGYAPLVADARAMAQQRIPAMQQRLQMRQQEQQGAAPAFARGGSVKPCFAGGGYNEGEQAAMTARGFYSPFLDARAVPEGYYDRPQPFSVDERRSADTNSRGFFERMRDTGRDVYDFARDTITDLPAAAGREIERYRENPLGHAAEVLFPWTPMGAWADMKEGSRAMLQGEDWLERGIGAGQMVLGGAFAPGYANLAKRGIRGVNRRLSER